MKKKNEDYVNKILYNKYISYNFNVVLSYYRNYFTITKTNKIDHKISWKF